MAIKKYELTSDHRAQLEPWARRWIANALSTAPMTAADRDAMRVAVRGLYAAAKLTPPPDHRIVFVPSPFVARVAGGFAAAIWWRRKNTGQKTTWAATEAATAAATDAATWAVTSAATSDATEAATDAATWAATLAATDAATEAATDAATWAVTSAATSDATEAATDAATWAATLAATDAATEAATAAATADATDAATEAATWAATWDATADATRAATVDATVAATRAATSAATRDATRAATSAATEAATAAATADATWYRGMDSGHIRYMAMRLGRGTSDLMLHCAERAYNMWSGGNQWSGYVAFLSFFRHIAQLPLDYSQWQHYEAAAIHGGPRVMHAEFCLVSDRPRILRVDDQSRPHCADGPFCQWADGTALYAWHGVRVPWPVIEHPERITLQAIQDEPNAEVRRVMIERMGWDRYLAAQGAQPQQSDACGDLYRTTHDGETVGVVVVTNSTPEPDGTHKRYALLVPPEHETARSAVAWTFGLTAEQYQPAVET